MYIALDCIIAPVKISLYISIYISYFMCSVRTLSHFIEIYLGGWGEGGLKKVRITFVLYYFQSSLRLSA